MRHRVKSVIVESARRITVGMRARLGWGIVLFAAAALAIVIWKIAPSDNRAFNMFLAATVGAAFILSAAQLWVAGRQLTLAERQQVHREEEEARLPDVEFGLDTECSSSVVFHPDWQPDRDYSQGVTVPVTIVNKGARAARQLVYNLLVPDPVRNAMTSYFSGGISPSKHPPKGVTQFVYQRSDLAPQVRDVQDIVLAFPRGSASYECPFILQVEDLPPVEGQVNIEVVDEGSLPTAQDPRA